MPEVPSGIRSRPWLAITLRGGRGISAGETHPNEHFGPWRSQTATGINCNTSLAFENYKSCSLTSRSTYCYLRINLNARNSLVQWFLRVYCLMGWPHVQQLEAYSGISSRISVAAHKVNFKKWGSSGVPWLWADLERHTATKSSKITTLKRRLIYTNSQDATRSKRTT